MHITIIISAGNKFGELVVWIKYRYKEIMKEAYHKW